MVESASTRVNKAQLVGTHDGTVIIPVYDWCSYLEQYYKGSQTSKATTTFDSTKTSLVEFISKRVTEESHNPSSSLTSSSHLEVVAEVMLSLIDQEKQKYWKEGEEEKDGESEEEESELEDIDEGMVEKLKN